MELRDTVVGMESADYKERFRAEYEQLRIRLNKLESMITAHDEGRLDFTPDCPVALLKKQASIMSSYKRVLKKRAELEGIEL